MTEVYQFAAAFATSCLRMPGPFVAMDEKIAELLPF
jgi:hypothetical protein